MGSLSFLSLSTQHCMGTGCPWGVLSCLLGTCGCDPRPQSYPKIRHFIAPRSFVHGGYWLVIVNPARDQTMNETNGSYIRHSHTSEMEKSDKALK